MKRLTLILLLIFAGTIVWLAQPQSSMNTVHAPDADVNAATAAEFTAEVVPTLIVFPSPTSTLPFPSVVVIVEGDPADFIILPGDMILQITNDARATLGLPTLSSSMTPTPTRDPQSYQIVYLLAENAVPADRLYSPENMAHFVSVKVAHRWDDVLRYDAETPIEILILHESARDMVDYLWTAQASRRGVVFGTINLGQSIIDRLYNNHCRKKPPVDFPPGLSQEGYWMITYQQEQFADPVDGQKWLDAKYITCTHYKLTTGMYRSGGSAQGSFARLEDIEDFLSHIEFRASESQNSREFTELQFAAQRTQASQFTPTPTP